MLLSFVLVMATLLTSVMAEDNPRAVIIFDASGSMWGQINGKAKIEIARDALKNVVKEWNPSVELGLTVYGHRSKGDCNDIETVIPVGKIDKNRVIKTVMGIKPKGKTPISRSLRKVAYEIKYTEEKATIILISDGKETCDPDPCGTAKELEKEGIDFVTHVIGFNVDKKTDKQLECIASATGGEYFSAKNAAALNKAMKVIAKKVEKPKPVVKNTILVPVIRYDMSPSGLNLSDVQLEVSQDGQTIYSGSDEAPKVDVKIGSVHLKAIYSRASIAQTIEKDLTLQAKEKNVVALLVKSGQVIIDTAEEQGGPKVKSSVHIYPVIDGELNRSDEIAWCVPTKTEACERILPIGDFFIEATYNGMKTQKQFNLADKEQKNIHLYFKQTGKVKVSASEKEGGKWIDGNCRLHNEDKSDSWGIAPRKKESSASVAQLPVGKYTLNCNYNAFKKKDIPVEVKAGETTKVHVVFGQTGTVKVSASEKEGGKWIDANCRIHNEDKSDSWGIAPRKKESSASVAQLPVGKYTLNCEYNAFKKKDIPVEVKAGETTKVHVVFGQTGKVKVSASEKEGGKWIDGNCRIHNEDKSNSWGIAPRKKESSASVVQLPVGEYTLNCEYNAFKKKDIPVEVKAGETTKVHVVFGQFFIEAKCSNMGDKINYEIYASSGQLVYEKKMTCSNTLKITLDNGDYSVEAKVGSDTKEVKFTVSGSSNKLLIDMTDIKREPTKEELIKADSQETPETEEAVVVPVTPKKTEAKKTQSKSSQINIGGKKIEIEGMSEKEAKQIEQLGAMLGTLGGMMKGANTDTEKQKQKQEAEDSEADKEFDEMSKDLDMFTK